MLSLKIYNKIEIFIGKKLTKGCVNHFSNQSILFKCFNHVSRKYTFSRILYFFFKELRGNLSHCILEQKKYKPSVKTPRMTESIVRIGTF